jgi:hypothetical protein
MPGRKTTGTKGTWSCTHGLPLLVMVTPADPHDSAAAKEILFRLRWADSAYAGKLIDRAKRHLNPTIKPVSRPKDASGLVILPRR